VSTNSASDVNHSSLNTVLRQRQSGGLDSESSFSSRFGVSMVLVARIRTLHMEVLARYVPEDVSTYNAQASPQNAWVR
jgi:hypothetical protein